MTFALRLVLVCVPLGCGPAVEVPDGPEDAGSSDSGASGGTSDSSATSVGPSTASVTSSPTAMTTVDPPTASGSTSGASDSDEYTTNVDSCGFLGCSDLPSGTMLTPCDPLFDPDCGEGRKCTYDHHPKGGGFVCGDLAGDGEHGDPCEIDNDPYDTCAEGFSCQAADRCAGNCCVQLCDLELEDSWCTSEAPTCAPYEGFEAPLGVCA